ncbi:hypothetical protein BDV26DRAFT_281769 [Aspergillus bertholletiae]|uniref:Fumarylacetoacetase-like C-terminal domain-containing protein n=1 Tax=Aspergillus bertholletiae TaxID=1226010 RepID=A0A5N7B732_9EURO|nr:hypothetical protein BDV26DRAFT_281769 [Aspergillus bertholletiae]
MQVSGLRAISLALRTARSNQNPIQTPTKTWPTLDAESGFEVQRITAEDAISSGDRLAGYKLGNIAKVMQDAFGLDHPDYGFLLASTFVNEGTSLYRKQYIKPSVELEPAFVVRGPLRGPNCTVADIINATDYAIPVIETIGSPDNGSSSSVILGSTPRKLTELTLRDIRGTLRFNDWEVMSGNTANILGNPLSGTACCLEALPMEEARHWTCTFESWGTIEFDVV